MGLFLTHTFQKNFKKLPKEIQIRVKDALQIIYADPLSGKKLTGQLKGEYSYRIGKYRIIYFPDEKDNIWIETVRHRKDIYRSK